MFTNRSNPSDQSAAQVVAPVRGSQRRIGIAALLALTLTADIAGGATGTVAATHWLGAESAGAAVITARPVSAEAAPSSNVAGAVYNEVGAAVVHVVVSGQARSGLTPYGSGSGVVIDQRGLILTNYHVVADARAISVRFSTGDRREAQVVGTDRGNDLALLKVDLPANVPVAQLGDSDQVQVGETAIAIGTPFGLEQTVTQGIISAVDRDWQPGNGRVQRHLLQTDAPINPGSSGGPLLNDRGEVIGITSMIESPVNGSVGVGFAIPINTAKTLLPQLEAGAHLGPDWLGITGQDLDQTIAQDQGLTVERGVLVTSVVPNSPAARAGLRGGQGLNERIPRGGDVITSVDGQPIDDTAQLTEQLAQHKPGDVIQLAIVRAGQERQVSVTLEEWPEE